MVDNIVWRRFPYYVERTVHKRFANEQDDWTEREKERYKKNKSINAAYESYHLLWDDFMNTLRDIRERPHALPTERALYAAPSALELTGKTGSVATETRILYMKRWTRLQELAEEMADNEYVKQKNESAGVSRTSYIDSLLAMVFA
jgi:hypothetical protein